MPSNRSNKKGGLTGSKHFQTPENSASIAPSSPNTSTTSTLPRSNKTNQVRRSANSNSVTGTDALGILEQAKSFASGYGVQLIDLASEMSGDPYSPSGTIPQMEGAEAAQKKLIIEKQNNALEVRLERTKQKRKIAGIYKEDLSLVGDLVDIRKVGFDVAKKYVGSEISYVDFQTEQSKLEEHQELLQQQIIRTEGVRSLTPGIQTEWDLKLQKQTQSNQRLQEEIQNTELAAQSRREQIQASMF
ncbi:hypothetical protein [Fischerella sp. PCC 9605]|uniref:hypothetical protein n=1 Tax=Fischerella sp. PCC 9605 TaxID=1173024 RepID=UPI00047A9345|nr:hypothetical protein [Fischerella sp. PCC 9605]